MHAVQILYRRRVHTHGRQDARIAPGSGILRCVKVCEDVWGTRCALLWCFGDRHFNVNAAVSGSPLGALCLVFLYGVALDLGAGNGSELTVRILCDAEESGPGLGSGLVGRN